MTKNKIEYEISDSLIKELDQLGIDAIREIEAGIQNNADEYGEEIEIIRK